MRSFYKAAGILVTFFIVVFACSWAFNPYYPVLIIAGESSVGTWMSGVLLVMSATLALILGMRQDSFQLYSVAVFFIILALDERFMFHEQLKERIIFSLHNSSSTSRWLYELPVIVGAGVGLYVVYVLYLKGLNRTLLLCTAVLGFLSVLFDILSAGVVWEECFKLLAELLILLGLLRKVSV